MFLPSLGLIAQGWDDVVIRSLGGAWEEVEINQVYDAGGGWKWLPEAGVWVYMMTDTGNTTSPEDFVHIHAGTFTMGSPTNEPGRYSREAQHEVTLTRDFYLQTTEVTNAQMVEVLNWALGQGLISVSSSTVRNLEGNQEELLVLDFQISWNGSALAVDSGKEDYPCLGVTWYGGQAYCNYLSDMEGKARAVDFSDWDWSADVNIAGYRLPTEAEWEYACRAGTSTAFYSGEITQTGPSPLDPNLNAIGWYGGNTSPSGSKPVGQKQPNAWGLYDMSGNVWEWCSDWNGRYPSGSVTDPEGPYAGSHRVVRGGSWSYAARHCRSAYRANYPPLSSYHGIGFRPALSE